jgi:hypothetical protein
MTKRICLILTIILLVIAVFSPITFWHYSFAETTEDNVFFGVSFGGKTASEAKLLIDKVKGYTNFFVVNSWDLSSNETALDEVCNYTAEAGLNFIVFFDYISLTPGLPLTPWHGKWVSTAKDKWPEKFLGIYLYDEPGGRQIDTGIFDNFSLSQPEASMFKNLTSYEEAAEVFLTQLPNCIDFQYLQNNSISKYTSDYALYWFDYLAGYDTVFVELGWNHSRPQHIGLCRGAARAQEKEWGAIITWTYRDQPYLADGPEIFEDLMIAYETGAKYIIVLDYPTYPETDLDGVLSDKHFAAMERFWNRIHAFPENILGKVEGEVAFVLPKDYGWGMRRPDDSIWGLRSADNDSLSPVIWEKMTTLIERYGLRLDILYDDPRFSFDEYSKVYYWNSSID